MEHQFCEVAKFYVSIYSKFEGNSGGKGATIDFIFYSGKLENVKFNSNRGAVIRVSLYLYMAIASCIYQNLLIAMHISTVSWPGPKY